MNVTMLNDYVLHDSYTLRHVNCVTKCGHSCTLIFLRRIVW